MDLTPWIGPAIVAAIVTVVGQFTLSRITRSHEQEKGDLKAWTDAVMPAQEAADDVVARFFDIFVRKRQINFAGFSAAQSAKGDVLRSPSQELTTVFRLIKFFASVTYLQRKLPSAGDIMRLRQSDLYVSNKVRMALKGNIAGSALKLPTETQQCVGAKFLDMTPSKSPHELDFYQFVKALRTDAEACELTDATASVLNFGHDLTELKPEQVAFALVLIYMIDFHQDLLNSSKWEEFRVLLISVVRAWNRSSGRAAVFLYAPKDLATDDYRDSFATLDFLKERRWRRWWRLRARQNRGRALNKTGLRKVRGSQVVHLRHTDSPGDVHRALTTIV